MHIIFNEHEHPSYALPFGVSMVVHALLLILIFVLPAHMPKEPKQTVIEVWPTAPAEIEKMASATGKMRIADIDPPAVQKRPKKARFVGLYDSSVEEETVSRYGGRGRCAERCVRRCEVRERRG